MAPENAAVFLVEDDELTLEAAKKALKKSKHRVIAEASDKKTALSKIAELVETPDVALLDATLPVEPGGYESEYAGGDIAVKLNEKFPQTTIVTFSSAKIKFSKERFPATGEKSEGVISRKLGKYVTGLPSAKGK